MSFSCIGAPEEPIGRLESDSFVKHDQLPLLFSPLTTPPLWPPKREYNAVSAIADENLQYRTVETSRYLTKITTLRGKADREGSAAKHTASNLKSRAHPISLDCSAVEGSGE